ncbi:helix-turn-helix domain-containing protein [Bifidobacterium sp. SO4]|uniref:helix-turn-helix transcriptional regulator n=1 Tax=Bifidobacterium sp. SO4 TaxID=2809030 RepID=UPI001BDD90DB|nr:helix-turn-helix domain-containing protein [Bifidobacterium sp. SO4]MBT1169594.1 helix-turn-helix domain-containing protein [Bifidobacterium sp. SO4]
MTASTIEVPSALADIARELPPLVDTETFAQVFHVPRNTQNDWRGKGRGPRFTKIGRTVYYQRDAVLEWLKSREFSETAECRSE